MLNVFKDDINERRAIIRNLLKKQHDKACARKEGGQDYLRRSSLSDSESELAKQEVRPIRTTKSESRLKDRFNLDERNFEYSVSICETKFGY